MPTKIEIHESRTIHVNDFLTIELTETFLNVWFLKISFSGQGASLRIKCENKKSIDYFELIKGLTENNN